MADDRRSVILAVETCATDDLRLAESYQMIPFSIPAQFGPTGDASDRAPQYLIPQVERGVAMIVADRHHSALDAMCKMFVALVHAELVSE